MAVEKSYAHIGFEDEEYSLDFWGFSPEDQGVEVSGGSDFHYRHDIDDEAVYIVGRLLGEDLDEDEYRERIEDSNLMGSVRKVEDDCFSMLFEGDSRLMFE